MATRTITTHTDDIDGSEEARTIQFSLEGTHFEIDLSEEHVGDLREALAPYVGHARRISAPAATTGARRAGAGTAPASRDYDPKVVRAWATQNDIEVPARGRVPLTVIEAYRQANSGA